MTAIIIAIDGYSSTGKSTLAKTLAKVLGYTYIDTGAMYRAVSLYALQSAYVSESTINEKALIADLNHIQISFTLGEASNSVVCLNGVQVESEIRGMEVSNCVSRISAIPEVRSFLVNQQQEMGAKKGVVMDGRDIGSVVFPHAELKLFMTAKEEIRAQRRYEELRSKGVHVDLESVKSNIAERDYRDTNRKIAPLIQVDDAIVLDNSTLTPEEQLDWVLEKVQRITSKTS
jgi:cytidylate kinase